MNVFIGLDCRNISNKTDFEETDHKSRKFREHQAELMPQKSLGITYSNFRKLIFKILKGARGKNTKHTQNQI